MTKTEKRRFVRIYMGAVRDSVLSAIEHMPDDWDGIELRWYITNKCEGDCPSPKLNKARHRAFWNDIRTRYGL